MHADKNMDIQFIHAHLVSLKIFSNSEDAHTWNLRSYFLNLKFLANTCAACPLTWPIFVGVGILLLM